MKQPSGPSCTCHLLDIYNRPCDQCRERGPRNIKAIRDAMGWKAPTHDDDLDDAIQRHPSGQP